MRGLSRVVFRGRIGEADVFEANTLGEWLECFGIRIFGKSGAFFKNFVDALKPAVALTTRGASQVRLPMALPRPRAKT